MTDAFTDLAAAEILATSSDRPFYQLDYTSPHGDYRPRRAPAGPPQLRLVPGHFASRTTEPRAWTRATSATSRASSVQRPTPDRGGRAQSTASISQKQLEALSSVDEGVTRLILQTLGGVHRLRNTYVIFVSDNGFFFGEHRLLGGKFLAYEPATHLPFLIRGPGMRPGSSTGELSGNLDIAPTILELAGAEADKSIDGRSMVPYLHDPPCAAGGRCSSSPSSRPTTSNSRGRSTSPETRAAPSPTAVAARPPPSSPRPRTTRESASAPTSTSPGPTARRSSTTSTGTRTSSTTSPRSQLLPDPQLPPRGTPAPGGCVGESAASGGEIPADPEGIRSS